MFKVADYQFDLPASQIALHPVAQREDARLMVVDRQAKKISHQRIADLPKFFNSNDLLVVNDTRVVPCRVDLGDAKGGCHQALLFRHFRESQKIAVAEAEGVPFSTWQVISKKLKPGLRLTLGDTPALVGRPCGDGSFTLLIDAPLAMVEAYLARHGLMPLPPYILKSRAASVLPVGDEAVADIKRYQSIFAASTSEDNNCHWSVAAPTASLHFSDKLLKALRERGVDVTSITLHIGRATFQPIQVDDLREHLMGYEWFLVPENSLKRLAAQRHKAGRVVLVGTTVVRTLESAAQLQMASGWTNLYIYPGYQFSAMQPNDALLTNFHLPGSTLLLMTMAWGGSDLIRHAYSKAIAEGYRFYSYGDAMLII